MADPELSKEFLIEHYINQNKNRHIISAETGVSPVRIGSLLQKYGIKRYSAQRHGLMLHPLNIVWCGMKERCFNKNADNYKWYGGNGITVCDEWLNFKSFYDWAMTHGWERGLTLDRIDGKRGYYPDNCRFITPKQQCRNRRTNKPISVKGITMLQCEWEEKLGFPRKSITKWKHRHGMEYVIQRLEEALENDDD